MRRSYSANLMINSRRIRHVVIDSHYEAKHGATVNDEIILTLTASLDGGVLTPGSIDDEGFAYFATGPHFYNGNPFRLIWVLPPSGSYIGIVNCYRRRHGKG